MVTGEQEENKNQVQKTEKERVQTLREMLDEVNARSEANLSGWQRAQADFINYKRRIEQERDDFTKYANSSLILSLLPVLDDLDQASNSIVMPTDSQGIQWLEGFNAIARKFRKILESQGITEIKAVGEPFNIQLHEAVLLGKGEEDIVIGELQRGYKLYDKLLRPAKVIVGSGESE